MEQRLTIRPMETGDAEAVAGLTAQLGYERGVEDTRAWIAESGIAASGVAADHQAAFVACLDGDAVGWIEISIERRLQSAPFALIGGLVVDERMRGSGIGLKLLRHAEEWAWARGLDTIRVTSRSTRERAHQFYLRDGYESVKMSMVFEKRRR